MNIKLELSGYKIRLLLIGFAVLAYFAASRSLLFSGILLVSFGLILLFAFFLGYGLTFGLWFVKPHAANIIQRVELLLGCILTLLIGAAFLVFE